MRDGHNVALILDCFNCSTSICMNREKYDAAPSSMERIIAPHHVLADAGLKRIPLG
jgi:hypothetical protein